MSYINENESNNNNGNEIIRISINSLSNGISSHLSNLDGVSCTTNNETTDSSPFCDWIVTHCNNYNNIITPRIIVLDNVNNIHNYHNTSSSNDDNIVSNVMNNVGDMVETWTGKIQQIPKHQQSDDITIPQSYNTPSIKDTTFQNFHHHAQQLISTTNQYKKERNTTNHKRYVDWDDLEEEEDEDAKLKRQYRTNKQINNLQDTISECWKQCLEAKVQSENDIYWYDYLLPPYPQESCFITINDENINDKVEESLRVQLEVCDSISGFQLLCNDDVTTNTNAITKNICDYIHDECKSSGIFGILSSFEYDIKSKMDQKIFMTNQLLYSTLVEQSNIVLPINLSSSILKSPEGSMYHHFPIFYSTAMISSLLHSISLPYRISAFNDTNSLHVWNRNIGEPTKIHRRISYRQYLQSMSHFNHYNIVETDVLFGNNDDTVSCNFDKLSTISNTAIDPLLPIPRERQDYFSTVHEYHTLDYTHPISNQSISQIIQSYQPKQCMSFNTNYTLPLSSYWKHLFDSRMSIPYSVLSNSTRSCRAIQKHKNLFSRMISKHLVEEEDDDLLEILEFWNGVEHSYTPSSILRSSCFLDDVDDYFDDLE